MKLGMEVGLGSGHNVLDGDPTTPPQKKRGLAHVCCDQTTGWIKMSLGMEVGLGLGDIVLDGNPALPKMGAQQPPHFSAHVLWPNGWTDQDATWHRGRPRPRRHCVRWGPSSPSPLPEMGIAVPLFLAHVYCGQTVAYLSYC